MARITLFINIFLIFYLMGFSQPRGLTLRKMNISVDTVKKSKFCLLDHKIWFGDDTIRIVQKFRKDSLRLGSCPHESKLLLRYMPDLQYI